MPLYRYAVEGAQHAVTSMAVFVFTWRCVTTAFSLRASGYPTLPPPPPPPSPQPVLLTNSSTTPPPPHLPTFAFLAFTSHFLTLLLLFSLSVCPLSLPLVSQSVCLSVMWMCVSLSLFLPLSLSSQSVCLSVCLSVSLVSVCVSVCLSVVVLTSVSFISVCLFVCLHVCLSSVCRCLKLCLFHLSLSICLSVVHV